jgi:hypothetical protein
MAKGLMLQVNRFALIALALVVSITGCHSKEPESRRLRHNTRRQSRCTAPGGGARAVVWAEAPAPVVRGLCRVTVLVDAGSVVAGDTLANLDGAAQRHSGQAARANAEKLKAQLENQERTVARLEDLVRRNWHPAHSTRLPRNAA